MTERSVTEVLLERRGSIFAELVRLTLPGGYFFGHSYPGGDTCVLRGGLQKNRWVANSTPWDLMINILNKNIQETLRDWRFVEEIDIGCIVYKKLYKYIHMGKLSSTDLRKSQLKSKKSPQK